MKQATTFKETEIGMIPEGWNMVHLSDVTTKITKGTTPTTSGGKFVEKGINFVKVESLNDNGTVNKEKFAFIDDDTNRLLLRSQLQKDDILYSIAGTIGRVALVTSDILPANTNQAVAIIRPDKSKINLHYLRYALINPALRNRLLTKTVQAVQANLSLAELGYSPVPLPSVDEQQFIAETLYSVDERIQLNVEINKTLESIGQALFKRWFVDFEFPDKDGKPYKSSGGKMIESKLGPIPEGWSVKSLNEAATISRGFGYSSAEKSSESGDYVFLTLNSVNEGGGFKRVFAWVTSARFKDRNFVKQGDIIIAATEQTKRGTLLGQPALVEFPASYQKDKGVFSQDTIKVEPATSHTKHYLHQWLLLNQPKAVEYHTGSVIWHLDVSRWSQHMTLAVPPNEVASSFEALLEAMTNQIRAKRLQSEELAEIRNTLLPRLMSGKIRVNA